jgi:hypothetical protein
VIFCEARPFHNSDDPGVHPVFRGKTHVHLMADDERELRLYTASIGVPVKWIQRDAFGIPHFDLTGKHMRSVQADPRVIKMDRREFVMACRARRAARLPPTTADERTSDLNPQTTSIQQQKEQ